MKGKLLNILEGHAHWVNSLSLNVDFVLKTGYHDHTAQKFESKENGISLRASH